MFLGLRSRPAPVSQGLKTPGGPPTPAPCTGCLGSLEGQNSPPQRGRGTPPCSNPGPRTGTPRPPPLLAAALPPHPSHLRSHISPSPPRVPQGP